MLLSLALAQLEVACRRSGCKLKGTLIVARQTPAYGDDELTGLIASGGRFGYKNSSGSARRPMHLPCTYEEKM